MSEKTVRKYRDADRLPSQLERPAREYRTRTDPLANFWPEIEALLEADRQLKPYAILMWLKQKYNHPSSPPRVTDEIRRTLERRVLRWKLEHGVEQEVHFPQVHHAGGAPRRIRSDSLSAAINNLSSDKEFTSRYRELLEHYGVAGHRINVRKPHENGDVESSHGHWKDSVDQALHLRGHRDFPTREAYIDFLSEHARARNAAREPRFREECASLVSAHHNHSGRGGYAGGFRSICPRSRWDVTSIKPCEIQRLAEPLEAV